MRRAWWPGLLATLGLVVAGCAPDFDPPWRVQDNRVLGARVEVDGAPDRAWPAPGEDARVTWPVADAGEPVPLTWAFAVCPQAPAIFGEPFCLEGTSPTVAGMQLTPQVGTPAATFAVPPEAELGGSTAILVLGVVCAGGTLAADPTSFTDLGSLDDLCQGPAAKAEPVLLTVPLALGGVTNENPDIARITLGGATWDPPADAVLAAPLQDCPDASLPTVSAGSMALEIGIEVTAASRETYAGTGTNGEPTTEVETMQVAHLTTGGDLDGLFTILDQPTTETRATTIWTPPTEATPHLVRFYFSVLDQRAGATFTTRALCLQ